MQIGKIAFSYFFFSGSRCFENIWMLLEVKQGKKLKTL